MSRRSAATKLHLATLAAAFWLGLIPAATSAQEAYSAKSVHLRAGPARDYPVVAILPPRTALYVQGCLSDYSWCDVIALGERGWMYAGNIDYVYQGVPVPLIDYGPVIGITIFGFLLGDYWDRYYHGRPWYPHRDEWIRRPRPVQPPTLRPPSARVPPRPAPPPHAAPPPHRSPPPAQPHPPRGAPPSPPRREPQEGHVPPPRAIAPGGGAPPRVQGAERTPPRKVEPKEPR